MRPSTCLILNVTVSRKNQTFLIDALSWWREKNKTKGVCVCVLCSQNRIFGRLEHRGEDPKCLKGMSRGMPGTLHRISQRTG